MKTLVILASYNGEKYIREQIDSILAQKDVNVDIKIYDDVSKDYTVEVIKQFSHDERIQISVNTNPSGSAANNFFNAIKEITNEVINQYDYIAFADQDDIWLPNKLNVATKMLQSENANLYMSNLILWEEKTNKKSLINKNFPQKKYDYLFEGGSAGCTYVFSSHFCIDLKQTLKRTDCANWKIFSHDWFVYFFARLNNHKVVIDGSAHILYRIHETNVHGQLNTNSFYALKERLRLIKEGWYFQQARGFMTLLDKNSIEHKIYELYSKNYISRLYVLLRYNFSLMRSKKKAIQFFLISLLPIIEKK